MNTLTVDQFNLLNSKNNEITQARLERQHAALKSYIEAIYPNPPKPKLESLQSLIQLYENKLIAEPNNTALANWIQTHKDKIANGDYAQPNTVDMEYHEAYYLHVKSFVWPTQDELDVRAVEDLVLENLRNSITN